MRKSYKALISVGAVAVGLSPIIVAVSLSSVDNSLSAWKGSHRDLVTTTNARNTTHVEAWSFNGALSNRGTATQSIYSVNPRLLHRNFQEAATVSDSYNLENPSDSEFGNFSEDINMPKEYLEFQLAETITLETDEGSFDYSEESYNNLLKSGDLLFDRDKSDFNEKLPQAKGITLKVRDDMYWVDHKGQKTEYQITARDFVEGFRYQLYFMIGGTASGLDGGKYAKEFDDVTAYYLKEWKSTWRPNKSMDNTYLLDIAGTDIPQFFGVDPSFQPIADGSMDLENSPLQPDQKNENGSGYENTLTFKFGEKAQPAIFMEKILLSGNFTYSPVPYLYLKDQYENHFDAENNMPKESTLAKMGMFKYALTYDKMLYAGKYYISANDAFKTVMTQNEHYWDKDWTGDPHTIRSLTQNYRTQDGTLLPIIQYQSFKQGIEYVLGESKIVSRLNIADQKILYDYDSMVYSFTTDPTSSSNQIVWTASPLVPKDVLEQDKAFFNSDFSKAMYGVGFDEYTEESEVGDQKFLEPAASVAPHFATAGFALRSQLEAYINWYAIKEQMSYNGDLWNTFTPSSAKMPDGETTALEAIYTNDDSEADVASAHEEGLSFDYYSYTDEAGIVKEGVVTAAEQKAAYQTSESILSAPESDLNAIKEAMKTTLSEIFTDKREYVLEFVLPRRGLLSTAELRKMYLKLATTFEELALTLDNGATVKISIKELGNYPADSYDPQWATDIKPHMNSNNTAMRYMGWSSDVSSLLGWYVGPLAINSYSSAVLSPLSSLLADGKINEGNGKGLEKYDDLAAAFPETTKLAVDFNTELNNLMKEIYDKVDKSTDESLVTGNKSSVLKDLEPDFYLDFHNLKSSAYVDRLDSDWIISENNQQYVTTELKNQINGIFNVAASTAIFNTSSDPYYVADVNVLLTLERELRNIVGDSMVIELSSGAGFISPSAKAPNGEIYKEWITTVVPDYEGIKDFAAWRVDEEDKEGTNA